jgi:amino acid adenylation domain-containing protein/FkbM family methyltransferase
MARAWQAAWDAHPALRAEFTLDGASRPVQRIRRQVRLPITVHAPESGTLEGIMASARETRFDVSRAPLARLDVVPSRPDGQDITLILTHHHLLFDGWSLPYVIGTAFDAYEAIVAGAAPVPPATGSLRDWFDWVAGRDQGASERFFRDRLAGFANPTVAPPAGTTDRPPVEGCGVAHAAAPAGTVARARGLGLTPNTVVQAAWALVLASGSGERDVVFGATSSGRPPEVSGAGSLVGLFINTLPVRARVEPGLRARDWMLALQRDGAALRQHEHAPLAMVQRCAQTPPNTPLFETLLVFENYPIDVESLGRREGFAVSRVVLHEQTNYPLTIVTTLEEGLRFRALYDRSRYDEEGIRRVLRRLEAAIESLLSRPDAPLGALSALPPDERERVLITWNNTAGDFPRDASVVEIFHRAALEQGDRPALLYGGEVVSYADLRRRARHVALALRERGVGLESRVALAMERSPDLVVAMLGVLEAGAAYVPVDPESPASRTALTLQASGTTLAITSGRLSSHVLAVPTVRFDDLAGGPEVDIELPRIPAGALAYVMFTSGSTGRPKGIEISHRNILRLVMGADYVRFGPQETFLFLSSSAFDLTTFEVWGALLHGGRLAIAPPGAASAAEIARLLDRHGVSVLWLTSGLFMVVVDEEPGALARVGQVLAGGDVVSPSHVRRLLAAGCPRVINGYGPTETTTFAAAGPLSPGDVVGERVPIGRPIANTSVYVLDRAMAPVPIGAAGELFVGGEGVARGYAGRPDLTAERFVPDPFGPAGARLYATGDLVAWRPDGRLEFLGRRDRQVKVRGFRVEVDDVESALGDLPGVRQAAVVPLRQKGVTELVAWLAADPPARDAASVRQMLAARVPPYMIPSRYVFLDEMPLSRSGKIDRRALPLPGEEPAPAKAAIVLRPAEEEVAQVWRLVLGVEEIGPDDDFFALGGHSLHATRVIARLRRLGADLPLRDLFDAPTVRALARRMEAARRAGAPPLTRAAESERRIASYAQSRLWFLDRLDPGGAGYTIAGTLRLEGDLNVSALAAALSDIARRHEALRSRFVEEGGAVIAVVEPPAHWSLPVEDLGSLEWADREREAEARAGAIAREPFDLARGPLARAHLLRLAPRDHLLVIALHHIVADGWSLGLFVDELTAGYAARARGEAAALPDLPVQYGDWAAWQRRWLEAGEMDRQLGWWRAELEGLEPLTLPFDRPRPARPTGAGASLRVTLGASATDRLSRLARAEGATLHMALLAAYAAVLGRWSGQDDFGIGTPVANRTRPEAETLIGVFVNTLVIRARLEGRELTYRGLLARLRASALGAYAHQDVPFERVVEDLQPDRDLSRTPLFQVMLILQNAPSGRLDLEGLRARAAEASTGTSTFDMTISLEPASGQDGTEPGGLAGAIEYSTELFDEATIARLWSHVERLIDRVLADPDARVRSVPLLSTAERDTALTAWSGRALLRTAGRLVHERFADVAAAEPAREAAVLGSRRMLYAELDDRSRRLAATLARHGVACETPVALCVERSPEMLVGMLGVLRAGGAFVPLDPDHPAERLAFAMEDSGARLALTTRALAARLPGGPPVVLLDDAASFAEASLRDRPVPPDSLAYIIYTSGTTGRPKGVMVSHRALASAFEAWRDLYGLDGIRVHLQMAGIAFDVCTGDVVRALGSGGTLVFCDRDRLLDPPRLFALARAEKAQFAEFVPAVLRQLAAHARAHGERLDSMRVAAVGSDVWTSAELRDFRAVFGPDTRLANSYGVTEATIDSACWFAGGSAAPGAAPPIGRPLSHGTVYVLDDGLEPAPPGVIGELYLGGPAVARGYAGRPAQTADRFVPDPFAGPGARLYRTGDRARYLPDGSIVFAGRADDQVKIRGQRIEPAEVEGALAAIEGVSAAAVVARPGPGGSARLAAYVVPRGDGVDPGTIRRALRERLPEAMIPAAIVPLAALPLTSNGKVDRRRLPEPDWDAARPAVEPATPAEAAVAAAFAAALELEKVGAEDDFFALGGHSLLATRVISRLRAALGVEVPLRALFEAPQVRRLAAVAESLAGRATPPPVRRAPEPERRLLSFAQRRLWFLDRLQPDSAAYNLPTAILMEGELDAGALETALRGLVARHEALRTRYVEGTDGPEQVIDPPWPIPLPRIDLSGLPEAARRAEAARLASEDARRPFDLARGPVLRTTLIRMGPSSHTLLLTVHHIAADGWSLAVFVREMGALYGAARRREPDPLPELAVHYADWAAWQRAWLQGEEMDRQVAWWKGELEGIEPLVIPGDRARPARRSFAGATLDVRLPAALRDGLDRLARGEGATLHMALLAGYAAALSIWSGQKDLVVGTPVANRRTAEAEPLIGFFVNTLALRVRLGGQGLTFRDLLGRVRASALGAHASQDVPFERVVEEIQPERSLDHNPLFQVLFALQNVPIGSIEMTGIALSSEEPHAGLTRFDLELFLAECPEGLDGLINFSTELFDPPTVQRFIENMTTLLEAAVRDPDRPLAALPSLAPAQRRRVLAEWNPAPCPWSDPPIVHTLFEAHARAHPGDAAARHGEERLTYAELDDRANRLARRLRGDGVGPDDRVAILMERSLDLIVALMATLKAGAAYVPIDPAYPPDRVALILQDSGARRVLSRSPLAHLLPEGGPPALLLDLAAGAIAAEPAAPLEPAAHPESLIYMVYTSGSTGRPKGVAMTHRAISNLLSFQRRDSAAPGTAAPRTLQFASLSFDVSFQEIFSTLTGGGEVVMVDEDERRDAGRLLRLIARCGVERLFVPFVALNQLAEAALAEDELPASLREIDTAGEQLSITPAIAAFFARLPGCRLVNHYGPSETHLVSTFVLEGPSARWPELPSIGRAIPNASVYLLDEAGRPVPIGAPGELCVGGAGLARGYHDRPGLTAATFVPDPFSSVPGARLYRTGDVARFTSGGMLEFLGRRDLQIKIRGHRVEPGEIEAALARLPAVRQAAVRAHQHAGGKRLAAYVVLQDGARATPKDLRDALAATLPEFMVPAAIVCLESLPLTHSGKVDRKALPEPGWGAAAGGVAPRTPEEEIACHIFAEVLGLSTAGAEDDFFHMGGHSLLATQVISRARRAFGVEIPLRALFESPTPAGLAAAARTARTPGGETPPPVEPAGDAARRELSYAQRRLWFLDRLQPGLPVFNVPAAVRLEGDLDAGALRRAIARIVQRHEALRTRFAEGPAGPEQIVEPPPDDLLALEEIAGGDALQREAEVKRRLAIEATRPFHLAAGPPLRARLFRLGPSVHVLSLVAHHIAADGWSVGILLRELAALYTAFTRGEPDPLPDLPVQYADWAAWQRRWLEGGELARQLAWWREELIEAPASLDLPSDRSRPSEATWNGATLPVRLSAPLAGSLERLARAEGATLHMVLLAGYAAALMRHGGAREVVVGVPVANRRAVEAEPLVGFFVNTLPVRVRAADSGLNFRELLARVREASLGAYAHQDVPFERVVEALQPERSLARAPIFQTAFALQSARIPKVELPGLRVGLADVDTGTSKLDLMLTMQQEDGALEGALEYNTDLFDRSSMERIASTMESILSRAAGKPAVPLAEASAPGAEEAARIAAWSGAGVTAGPGELLHELVAAQAARTPFALALANGGESIRYGEMERRANRLARHLRAAGARPDARVAVLLERSPEAIVSALAVLKAGAAFVPMEPTDPPERLRHVMSDSGAAIAVTESRFAGLVPDGVSAVALDRDAAAIAAWPEDDPGPAARPAHIAYVIYTSGSTGRPKGVAVEHRQIAAYVRAAVERLGIEPGWSFALVSTLSADLGHTSIFPALATGGCLHILPADAAFDAVQVERAFAAHPIDCMKIVPSHLRALLSASRPEAMLPRRLLVLGGESAPGELLRLVAALKPGCRVANHYGPTETTVGAVAGFPSPEDADRAVLPLGRPLDGARARVLDDRGFPVPAGVPGELFVGGAGVSRGYLDAPSLTAARFVPDPSSAEPGARLYRTGDRARWLGDGRLEFLGRADGQLKVRGMRVEPAEIEAALASCAGVKDAAVIARPDPAGGLRLAAWVVPEPRVAPAPGGRARRLLPSGIAVAELNRNETDYLHREIVELGAYARHGISLRDGDTVVDAGANIGLFSVWASLVCSPARLLVFEPNPILRPILLANLSAYAPAATPFDVGLAESARDARFTFFPGFSLLSGLYADAATESGVVKSYLENQARAGVEGAGALADQADALLAERFAPRPIDVRLRTLSEMSAEQGIDRISLLKINVEKAELDVLRGIGEELWPRIDQAVVEVDLEESLEPVRAIFAAHGFEVLVDQDPLLDGTPLRYVYAARRGSGRALSPGAPPSAVMRVPAEPLLTAEALRARLALSLPGPMIPTAWAFLDALPLTSNGKLDRRALPEPEAAREPWVAPRGEMQAAIARIWAEVLQREPIGAHDNFFDLGGHSLLLTRVHARLRESLGADLSVVELFRFPTVAALAARLAGSADEGAPESPARRRAAGRRDAVRSRAARDARVEDRS